MDVYFSHYITDVKDDYRLETGQDLLHFDLENLYDNLKDNHFLSSYLKCPAAIYELKRTFIVKSPIECSLMLDKKTNTVKIKSASNFASQKTFFPINDFFESFSLNSNLILFSQKSVNVTQLPPYMHHVSWKNQIFNSTGIFDISKWYRPLNATWIHNNNLLDLDIKRGDPLYYIRFETNQKINLIRYDMNEALIKYSRHCLDAKHWIKNRPLKFWYEKFQNNNYNKKIFYEIKKNLF